VFAVEDASPSRMLRRRGCFAVEDASPSRMLRRRDTSPSRYFAVEILRRRGCFAVEDASPSRMLWVTGTQRRCMQNQESAIEKAETIEIRLEWALT
jgi:hypothetical protein